MFFLFQNIYICTYICIYIYIYLYMARGSNGALCVLHILCHKIHGCLLRLRARGQTDNQTDPREARKQSNWLPGPGAQNNPRPGPKTIKNVPKQSQNAPKQSKNVNGAAFGGAPGRFAPREGGPLIRISVNGPPGPVPGLAPGPAPGPRRVDPGSWPGQRLPGVGGGGWSKIKFKMF